MERAAAARYPTFDSLAGQFRASGKRLRVRMDEGIDRRLRLVLAHAVVVYQKAGLSGRAELGAFFLEGLMLSPVSDPDVVRPPAVPQSS
jgi:hypothetical protein